MTLHKHQDGGWASQCKQFKLWRLTPSPELRLGNNTLETDLHRANSGAWKWCHLNRRSHWFACGVNVGQRVSRTLRAAALMSNVSRWWQRPDSDGSISQNKLSVWLISLRVGLDFLNVFTEPLRCLSLVIPIGFRLSWHLDMLQPFRQCRFNLY